MVFHNKHYEVPYRVSPIFTGREDVSLQLKEAFFPVDGQCNSNIQKRFVLHGLGGAGKTQVCLKFA